jgi:hypothetical protein
MLVFHYLTNEALWESIYVIFYPSLNTSEQVGQAIGNIYLAKLIFSTPEIITGIIAGVFARGRELSLGLILSILSTQYTLAGLGLSFDSLGLSVMYSLVLFVGSLVVWLMRKYNKLIKPTPGGVAH